MWSGEVLVIELVKSERGLGFSILDYQDPLNPTESVIVIRSLVPGGVSTSSTSSAPQSTSRSSCLISPFFLGPRQMTAESGMEVTP